ncbi:CHRD domain-containing protein [Paracoccus gahaiensis]|nr:CHRD domain-containing protein [Paracoccus gahaiensis]
MTFYGTARPAAVALAALSIFTLPAAAEEVKYMAKLTGEAQVPPVETEARGMADITVDTETMTLTWRITHEGLSGTPIAGHFHGPASPDENAPPLIDMGDGAYGATREVEDDENADAQADTGSDAEAEASTDAADGDDMAPNIMEGTIEVPEEQLADLQAGRYYVNIHTEAHPDGEIRGQVVEGEASSDSAALEGSADSATAFADADLDAGEQIFTQSCRSCHGPRAQGMASFPPLDGREADYLLGRLQQYHAGEKVGPGSALMIPVAKDLSEVEMRDVSAYIASAFN